MTKLALEVGVDPRALLGAAFDAKIAVHVPAIEREVRYEVIVLEPATPEEIADCYDILDDPDDDGAGPATDDVNPAWAEYKRALAAGVIGVATVGHVESSFVIGEDELHALCNGKQAWMSSISVVGHPEPLKMLDGDVTIDNVAFRVEDVAAVQQRALSMATSSATKTAASASAQTEQQTPKAMYADARALVALALLSTLKPDAAKAGDDAIVKLSLNSLARVAVRTSTDLEVVEDLRHALVITRDSLEQRSQRAVRASVGADMLRAAALAQHCLDRGVVQHGALASAAEKKGRIWANPFSALSASEATYLRVFKRWRAFRS